MPMIMGWVATLPISPYVNEPLVETALVAIIGAVYYAVMRLLEERGVKVASFLIGMGYTAAPKYQAD